MRAQSRGRHVEHRSVCPPGAGLVEAGISVACYEDDGGTAPEGEIVLRAGFAVGDDAAGGDTVSVVDLPVIEVASAIYRGGDDGILP